MAAYRQAKRMQRGVKLGYQQRNDNDLSTQFISSPIAIGVNDFSIEFFGNTFGSSSYAYNTLCNKANTNVNKLGFIGCWSKSNLNGIDYIQFTLAGSGDTFEDAVSVHWTADSLEEKFLLTITRQGTTVKVYINGELKTTKEQSEVKDIGDLQLAIANSSEVGFVRVWNMCLSADDVTAHYNNGDPMGYVVPKAMRGLEPVEITGSNSYTWTGVDSVTNVGIITNPNIEYGKFYVVNISVSDYEAGSPYLYIGYSYGIPKVNGNYNILIEHQYQSSNTILLFGGPDGTDRRLTLTVNSITPVGLLAEYLPQNLMIAQKRDFPQVVFPVAGYTPSSGVFNLNNLSATIKKNDQPQANGFSGAYTRFDAITSISLYCAYISDFIKKQAPLKITFEYRSNRILYSSNITASPAASDAVAIDVNEGDAKTASVSCGVGATAFVFSDSAPEAWLEMRVLSIEVAEGVALAWLDSAKQLPLNDEYLPPLLEAIVEGDATPIRIMGNNSYTWAGTESAYAAGVELSRLLVVDQIYRVSITLSGYEAGTPDFKISSEGTTNIPKADGVYTFDVRTKGMPYRKILLYGGMKDSDRRLTLTVNSIEPVVERGYDLAANGTPQIIIK